MAMIRVEPVQVDVRAGWLDGRPREIRWADRRLPVIAVVGVRDETAAYPVVAGPRTVFEVDTPLARLTLSFRHRTRRWTVDAFDEAEPARRFVRLVA